MNPDFQSHFARRQSDLGNSPITDRSSDSLPVVELDAMQRDRFELLSAYLDGEVTATERQQVENWLESDPEVQCLYKRLLKLRQGMQSLSLQPSKQSPYSPEQPTEQSVKRILQHLNRKPRRSLMYGGATAAALCIFALLFQFPGRRTTNPDFALQPETLNPEIWQALVGEDPILFQASVTDVKESVVKESVRIGLDTPVLSPPGISPGNADNPLQR